jgi:hypothetical protein
MNRTFRTVIFALAFCAAAVSFSACSNNTTEGDHDEHSSPINDSGVNSSGNDTNMMNSMDTGTTGGMRNMDPEGSGSKMDKHEDEMNAGNTNTNSTKEETEKKSGKDK